MKDERAAQILATLPDGEFLTRIKFIREELEEVGDEVVRKLVIKDKVAPFKEEERKGGTSSRSLVSHSQVC